jgi:organic hydroperoxide reductase OsmC/OhrA
MAEALARGGPPISASRRRDRRTSCVAGGPSRRTCAVHPSPATDALEQSLLDVVTKEIAMSAREPRRYDVLVERSPQGGGTLSSPGKPPIVGSAPSEFGGRDDLWSPEHLLVSAAALCFLTTFEWFARRATLSILSFRSRAEGRVEKTAGGLAFTGLDLRVDVLVLAGEAARARELLDLAKRSCLVANSLRPAIDLDAHVAEAAMGGLEALP